MVPSGGEFWATDAGTRDDVTAQWDAFVGPRTHTVTDLAAWRAVVRDAYGIRSHVLTATGVEA